LMKYCLDKIPLITEAESLIDKVSVLKVAYLKENVDLPDPKDQKKL
jgi:hypothetical protein